MSHPNTESHRLDIDHELNNELAKDFPEARLRHQKHTPGTPGASAEAAPRPPVASTAGVGAASWGPSSSPPRMTTQIDCIHADAQRLIEALQGMQEALALIRGKL